MPVEDSAVIKGKVVALLISVCGKPWKDENLDFFVRVSVQFVVEALGLNVYKNAGFEAEVLLDVMKHLLKQSRWFQYKSSTSIATQLKSAASGRIKDLKHIMFASCVAAKLLEALHLGAFVRTNKVTGGGMPNWWFVTGPVDESRSWLYNFMDLHETSVPSLENFKARNSEPLEIPTRAPQIDWAVVFKTHVYGSYLWGPSILRRVACVNVFS